MYITARLEFELAYFKAAIQHLTYTSELPSAGESIRKIVSKNNYYYIWAQSAGVVEYTNCTSVRPLPQTNVLIMTLNNLIVRL